MRLHRFYINEEIIGEAIAITDENLIHQWRNVFRYKAGDSVIIFDGKGSDFVATIKSLKNNEVLLEIKEEKKGIVSNKNLWLFVSIPKKDKLEWIVEKTTELGVSHIVPIISERSEKKSFKEERLKRIITEASEQSGRTTLPALHGTFTLKEVFDKHKFPLFVCDADGKKVSSDKFKKIKTAGIIIGPEGGWSENEKDLFEDKKLEIISLGDQTLRTETAAITAIALFLSL